MHLVMTRSVDITGRATLFLKGNEGAVELRNRGRMGGLGRWGRQNAVGKDCVRED